MKQSANLTQKILNPLNNPMTSPVTFFVNREHLYIFFFFIRNINSADV